MGEHLIKPYEISVWEDKLIQNGVEYSFEEKKLAVIGSDTMTGLNKVYDPVFNKKSNGEKSLTFSLKYRYVDPYSGEEVENPFAAYLVNERKIKLHYDGEWYEFIIKDHTESTEESTWTYTCADAFVLELSKQGYNITFDSELQNNQGTAAELASETLKDTDWVIGEPGLFKQLIAEPIYNAVLNTTGLTIINASNDGVAVPSGSNINIYLFYSYVKNRDGNFVQFIVRRDNTSGYTIDDRNVITDTNFRIITELVYNENSQSFSIPNGNTVITLDGQNPVETRYHANRLAYGKLNTYDKVMGKTVERLKANNDDREIYKYTDYVYTTSDVVMNYFTNGDDFNVLENGSLQGWSVYTDHTGTIEDLELVTNPELGSGKSLVDINALSQIEGFLKVNFTGTKTEQNGKIYNTIYNSGVENSSTFVDSISKGQKFVFRWRAGQGTIGNLSHANLGMMVAKYTESVGDNGYYYKHISTSDIVLDFSGTGTELNNYIEGGSLQVNEQNKNIYVIDGVAQTPSTKYIYRTGNGDYVWDSQTNDFVALTSNNYLPYYYLVATANRSVSHSELNDVGSNFGIFVYTEDNTIGDNPIYIQDIQFTRFVLDTTSGGTDIPVVIGNIPNASAELTDYYYLKPDSDMTADDVKTYVDLNQLESELGFASNSIKPLYNENSEKYLTISASQSNCFNILQTIAETFECWINLRVNHDSNGYIQKSEGRFQKFVDLKEYAGKDNYAGFKYGINLQSIERQINSDEIVTKLIVDQSQSDLVEEGYVSIGNASSNISGESYILNFDYYYNQGLLDRANAELDQFEFLGNIASLNNLLKQAEKVRESCELSLARLGSQRNDYTLMIEAAKTARNDALTKFTKLTKMTYDEYVAVHETIIGESSKTDSFTPLNTTDVENQFTLQYIPKDETTISLNIVDWGVSLDFNYGEAITYIGGEIDNFTSETTLESVNLNKAVVLGITERLPFTSLLDGIDVEVNIEMYIDTSIKDIISFNTGINSSGVSVVGGFELYNYVYDSATKILSITASEELIIQKCSYEVGYTILYDGFKTFKINGTHLGENAITFTYNLSIDNQLTDEETIADTLGELYSSSSVINNYSGLLTNIEQEYWRIRRALKGSENYTVKFWKAQDSNSTSHIYAEASDYIQGLSLIVSGNSYQFDLSHKYFDIQSTASTIDLSIGGSATFTFDDNTAGTKTFNISASPTTVKLKATTQANGIEDVIENYLEQKNTLTKAFNNKYSRYIQEGTWSSTEYIDPELYYLDALQVSNTSAQPVVSYTINVVEISELEGYEWYLFDAGEKSYVEDTEFFGWQNINGVRTPAKEEVIVSEVEWHLDDPSQNVITVQNYKTRFEDLFQRISAAVQTVQYNEASYAKTSTLLDATHTLNQNLLLQSLNNISGKNYSLTSNGSVVIDGEQILIQNLTNTANRVIINSEGIQVSSDGGITWKTVISGRGLNLNSTYTGSINTNNIVITGDGDSSVLWDSSGISSYRVNQDGSYDLNTYVRFDEYGLYGIKDDTFKAESLQDVINSAYFAVTWDGFFIRNSYSDGGRVSITSDNDFQVIDGNSIERIKIGSLGVDQNGERIYGINISDNSGRSVLSTNNAGDLTMTGTINALGGNFTGIVNVGPTNQNHIIIDGTDASIRTSNFYDGAGTGWMINADGDANFRNITARGAIKTAVFEYAEIEAVGGIFIFRPSSTIKSARIGGNNNEDLILKVEKPYLFAKIRYNEVVNPSGSPKDHGWYRRNESGSYIPATEIEVDISKTYYEQEPITSSWCKVSNYTNDGMEPNITSVLRNNGLTHVYRVSNVNFETKEVTLEGAAIMVTDNLPVTTLEELEGGALIDMGRAPNDLNYDNGVHNYGIGINSSDNTVNLPARAISLFETVINSDPQEPVKVTYNFRGILGTLPTFSYSGANPQVSELYHNNLEGTQGIYTDNMYLGDANQYLTFYTDKTTGKKQLRIKASEIIYEVYDGETGEPTGNYQNVNEIEGQQGPPGEDAVYVKIESNIGNDFVFGNRTAILTCYVYKGTEDITSSIDNFTWSKADKNGNTVNNWTPQEQGPNARLTKNQILITTDDVEIKSIFYCNVVFD